MISTGVDIMINEDLFIFGSFLPFTNRKKPINPANMHMMKPMYALFIKKKKVTNANTKFSNLRLIANM